MKSTNASVPFIVSTEGIIDEAWCRKVKRAMMTAAFAQFLREYANDRDGIKPSRAKRHAMADFMEKAAAYTEIGERCCGVNDTFNVAEAAEASEAAEEAYFKGLSRTCVIEGRIMVKELGDALQAAIKMPLPKEMPHDMAAAVFYARQKHFHAWGMGHMPPDAGEELRQRFSEALSQVLSAAASCRPMEAYESLHCEAMEAFIVEQLDGEDEREDARALISELDACLEKAVRNEIPKFCTPRTQGRRGSGGGGSSGSGGMTHVEWIRRIRGAMLILEQYFDKRTSGTRFFAKDARYHMEMALRYPCSKRHFDERIGDVVAVEMSRFDARMALMSRFTHHHASARAQVTRAQVAAAVGLCRRKMDESGVYMTAYHQATLSGMLYAMEPDDVDAVAYFCAAEFVGSRP